MWQPFSEHLRKAIVMAQAEAQRTGGGSIGTEHILLGMVAEGASSSAQLLLEWGVGLEAAREAAGTLGHHPSTPVHTGDLVFTANAKQLIEQCFDVAREAGHDYVGSEHMLAAMTRQRAGGARTVIENVVGETRFPAFAQAAFDAVGSASSGQPSVRTHGGSRRTHVTSFPGTPGGESETALYTECLRVASAALGPGASLEAVRENAKTLFEQALADIAAALKKQSPPNAG
ncbi:MAG TPA: Clp protease N-terminal domain-containing protein [Candidatus Acidoferrales bacterium]|nr:Clp protease N-terminal domain-containing protein [Candidatus Acidoferrales bacterium]